MNGACIWWNNHKHAWSGKHFRNIFRRKATSTDNLIACLSVRNGSQLAERLVLRALLFLGFALGINQRVNELPVIQNHTHTLCVFIISLYLYISFMFRMQAGVEEEEGETTGRPTSKSSRSRWSTRRCLNNRSQSIMNIMSLSYTYVLIACWW